MVYRYIRGNFARAVSWIIDSYLKSVAEIETGSIENIFLILNSFCLIGKQKRNLRDWLWKFLFSQRKLSLSVLSYKVQIIIKTTTSSNPAEVMFAINLLKLFIGGLRVHFYCAKPAFTKSNI